MMKPVRKLHTLLAALAVGAGLQAQDPWQGGFKLTAASVSGASQASLGQDRGYGLALFGAYPLGRSSAMAFEAGYRFLPTTTHGTGSTYNDDKTDGYYGSALFQYRLLFDRIPEGLHVQAGLRVSQYLTNRRSNFLPGDGSSLLTKYRGEYATAVKPVLGLGYRLTEKYGLELNVSPTDMKNVDGLAKTTTMVELALLIHL